MQEGTYKGLEKPRQWKGDASLRISVFSASDMGPGGYGTGLSWGNAPQSRAVLRVTIWRSHLARVTWGQILSGLLT